MIKHNKIESLFFHVLEDLKDYLYDLTLVGGWVPYVYTRFLWRNVLAKPVTTVDIDFGFGEIGLNFRSVLDVKFTPQPCGQLNVWLGDPFMILLYKK